MVQVSSAQAYEAARHGTGLVDRAEFGYIVVSGKDRASYLQGLLTNDVAALKPGEGCYAAYLTAQGRMIADLWVYELGDVMLLRLLRDVKATVLARLDQFIFSEDVQLGDVTDAFMGLGLVGPRSAATLAAAVEIDEEQLTALSEHGNLRAQFLGQPAIVLRTADLGEAGFDVLVEAIAFEPLRGAVRRGGAAEVDLSTAETLRIEAGVPKFHQDMDEDTIPLEAGIESRAISLTKGCYVGQEVIIRVLHRGHGRVARKLVGFVLDGDALPAEGAVVQAEGRDIGTITSASWSPALRRPIALGYVQRDFVTPGTRVVVQGTVVQGTTVPGTGAEVSPLPFVNADGRA